MEMTEAARQEFVRQLGKVLRQNYDVSDELLREELDSQLAGNKPSGFMGMVIENNLKKLN